jgi:hypothetical protein
VDLAEPARYGAGKTRNRYSETEDAMSEPPEPQDPFHDLEHGGDQLGNLLNRGALLFRGLHDADNIASVLRGIWGLDVRDLRRLALCTTMIAIQNESLASHEREPTGIEPTEHTAKVTEVAGFRK